MLFKDVKLGDSVIALGFPMTIIIKNMLNLIISK